MKPKPFFFRLARRHGSRRFRHNRCVDSTPALPFLQGMCILCHSWNISCLWRIPDGAHPPSSLFVILNTRRLMLIMTVISMLIMTLIMSRAENTSHSLFREPCTRISDHSPCPEGTHQSSSLLCYLKHKDEVDHDNSMPSTCPLLDGVGQTFVLCWMGFDCYSLTKIMS